MHRCLLIWPLALTTAAGHGAEVEKILYNGKTDGNWDIYWVDPDGSNRTKVTDAVANPVHSAASSEVYPEVSPDGKKILHCDLSVSPFRVRVIDLDNNVIEDVAEGCEATWSPDGDYIIYASRSVESPQKLRITAYPPGPASTRLIIEGCDGVYSFPDWHPSGDFILTGSDDNPSLGDDTCEGDMRSVNLAEVGRAEPFLLAKVRHIFSDERNIEARYSTDGERLAWYHNTIDRSNSVIVIGNQLPGQEVTRRSDDGNEDGRPAWSPDDRRIVYFSSDGRGNNVIRTVDSDPATADIPLDLTPVNGDNSYPTWDCISTDIDPIYGLEGSAGACRITVRIDVKPGSFPNCFNPNGKGVVPVAVLGAEDFDVHDVKTDATLSFNGLSVRHRGKKGRPLCSYEFSDADAYEDLVCQFEDDVGRWRGGEATATLTGELLDGTVFEGEDSICLVP